MNKNFDDIDDNPFNFEDDFNEEINFEETPTDIQKVKDFVAELPLLSPREIFVELDKLGYKGQDEQRRALSLMGYRHVRRLKRIHVEGVDRTKLPTKQNVLMIGPTGCGKTFMVELLFQAIFKIPTVIVDITSFTESGYVGDSVNTILTRLILHADGNPHFAQCGVVCLDEFDKLASSGSSARFAGQGTTKDVSGYGVQRELLAMLQGTTVTVPMDYGFSEYGYRAELSTQDIPFVVCGAFSGFEEILKENRANIGFQQKNQTDAEILTEQEAQSFQRFGFLPELIGRFSRIVSFPKLDHEVLRQILIENVLPQFQNEFEGEGLKLSVTDTALDFIVKRCDKRGTGARGLQTELITAVESAAFETFGVEGGGEIKIDVKDDRLTSETH
ncbi:MAG TPA: AAA family ATPase [Pyrinomonadaceae bacterium]|nr:AAA family ATPase [Pyrinomonadaceae bacterium]